MVKISSGYLLRRPIVHRAGGMLLQAQKELGICADLKPEDVYFYYTTTSVLLRPSSRMNRIALTDHVSARLLCRGWMMWNYLVHGLSLGCTLVLYDGSPLRDPAYLWRLVDELGITIFGTSAKYLDQLSVSPP